MKYKIPLIIVPLLFIIFQTVQLKAQDSNLSSDELFQRARSTAFDLKDYPASVELAKKALQQSPEYTDISVFLGRLYTWMDKRDSARMVFQQLEQKQVKDADFYFAFGSMEYWENNNDEALRILDVGLLSNSNSEDLLLLKSKILNAKGLYKLANENLNKLIETNPANAEALSLSNSIKEKVSGNEVGIQYNWMHFDKQFDDDWHIVSLSYKRKTPIGSFIFKSNFANKFGSNGTQFELEAYPSISKIFYMYLGAGYSNNTSLFPKFRTGASLYANLPASFEAEVGFRQMKFDNNIWIYTASLGKYYKNFWFNLRTYLTPDDQNISRSFTGTIRYYTTNADNYFGFLIGTGISPEENRENLWIDKTFELKTFKTGLEYNFTVQNRNLFTISGTYYNVEYKPKIKDNQLDFTIGYRRKF